MSFTHLSNEIISQIFDYIPQYKLVLLKVNKQFNDHAKLIDIDDRVCTIYTLNEYYKSGKDLSRFKISIKWDRVLVHWTVKLGNFEFIKYFWNHISVFRAQLVFTSVITNKIYMLKYIFDKFSIEDIKKLDVDICSLAAGANNRDIIIFTRLAGIPWNENTYILAIKSKHWNMVDWLMENKCPIKYDTTLINTCIETGNIVWIKYFLEKGSRLDENSIVSAINFIISEKTKSLDLLNFLRENKSPINHKAIEAAISKGSLTILKWLYEKGCKPEINGINDTVFKKGDNYFEVFHWLMQGNVKFNREDLQKAVYTWPNEAYIRTMLRIIICTKEELMKNTDIYSKNKEDNKKDKNPKKVRKTG